MACFLPIRAYFSKEVCCVFSLCPKTKNTFERVLNDNFAKFLIISRKNFHPFSGLFQWTLSVDWTGGDNGTTERVKIFPQKFFALKVGLGAGGAPGDRP